MSRQNLPLTRHAAMDMSAIGWGSDDKPGVAGLSCGG